MYVSVIMYFISAAEPKLTSLYVLIIKTKDAAESDNNRQSFYDKLN